MSSGANAGRLTLEFLKGLALTALLVMTMLWLSGAFVDKVQPRTPSATPAPPSLVTHRVEMRSFPLMIEQMGTVRTRTEAQVSSRIMAQVREILVREGDEVRGPDAQGQGATILARLDDRDIQARLRQAESQLQAVGRARRAAQSKLEAARAQVEAAKASMDQAKSDYGRMEQLHKERAATGQQLDQARAHRDMTQARHRAALQEAQAVEAEIQRIDAQRAELEAGLQEARVMLSHTVIQAPFSGRVTRKLVEVGDLVVPGRPILVLESPSHPELHAVVSESLLPSLRLGQVLTVQVDSLGRTMDGRLLEIVPSADPTTRTLLVKVGLEPQPDLVSGLFGRVRIPAGTYQALVVPASAVRAVGQLHLVDVKGPDGHPERRFVTLGNPQGEMIEVLSGLKEGEEVVLR